MILDSDRLDKNCPQHKNSDVEILTPAIIQEAVKNIDILKAPERNSKNRSIENSNSRGNSKSQKNKRGRNGDQSKNVLCAIDQNQLKSTQNQTNTKLASSPDNFISRNQKWIEEKEKRHLKAKANADKQKMNECTFKPKLNVKEFLMRKKSDQLRSKISKSLSPNRIFLTDQFDMSTLNKCRLRIERQDDGLSNCADQISPKNCHPSNDNSRNFEMSSINHNEIFKQLEKSSTFKKNEEIVLNLSKSPSFQHHIVPNKKNANNKDLLSCSNASKRLIANKSAVDANHSKNSSELELNVNERSVKISKKSSVYSISQCEETPIKSQYQISQAVKQYEIKAINFPNSKESPFGESVIKEDIDSSEFTEDNNCIQKFTNSYTSAEFEGADHSKYQDEYNSADFGSPESDSSFLKESQLSVGNEANPRDIEFDKYM